MVTFLDRMQLREHQHMPDTRRSQGLRCVEEKDKTQRERERERGHKRPDCDRTQRDNRHDR